MSFPRIDERVAEGMRRQLATRREALATGGRPVGWKLGFGSAAAMERLQTDAPLVGFLTDATLVADGAECALGELTNPVLEPEIAAHFGRDYSGEGGIDELQAALSGLSPAFEVVDVDPAVTAVDGILAANIFHRRVIVGAPREFPVGNLASTSAQVAVDGEGAKDTPTVEELTGRLAEILPQAAATLRALGEGIKGGEFVICGAVVPALPVRAGQTVKLRLEGIGELSSRFV